MPGTWRTRTATPGCPTRIRLRNSVPRRPGPHAGGRRPSSAGSREPAGSAGEGASRPQPRPRREARASRGERAAGVSCECSCQPLRIPPAGRGRNARGDRGIRFRRTGHRPSTARWRRCGRGRGAVPRPPVPAGTARAPPRSAEQVHQREQAEAERQAVARMHADDRVHGSRPAPGVAVGQGEIGVGAVMPAEAETPRPAPS